MFCRRHVELALSALALVPLASVVQAKPLGGGKRGLSRVEAHSTYVDHVTCRGGELTRLLVDGDTDLDVYVYDENGNLIGKDEDPADTCVATWFPRSTGEFTIRVVNRGSVSNRYIIIVN